MRPCALQLEADLAEAAAEAAAEVRHARSFLRVRDVDEVLEAAEPVVVRFGGGAVAEGLGGHEQRGVRTGCWTPKS